MTPRIEPRPAAAPGPAAERLEAMMPPGVPPTGLLMLAGWYHAISTANAARVAGEDEPPRFADVAP